MALPVLVLNGPNLNMLGVRQPEVYGRQTLADIEADRRAQAALHGLEIAFRQTNSEAELLGWVQASRTAAAAGVLNPAARSEARRGGKEWGSTCKTWVVPVPAKKKKKQ